jgi:putative endonuclease
MHVGWTYRLTNRPNGVLYTSVTADLVPRIYQHRSGEVSWFTSRYGIGRLVWFESHEEIISPTAREKSIANWTRACCDGGGSACPNPPVPVMAADAATHSPKSRYRTRKPP